MPQPTVKIDRTASPFYVPFDQRPQQVNRRINELRRALRRQPGVDELTLLRSYRPIGPRVDRIARIEATTAGEGGC